jgi:exodeoxyribonuclease VII large subunit
MFLSSGAAAVRQKICGRSTTKKSRASRQSFPFRWFLQSGTKPTSRFSILLPPDVRGVRAAIASYRARLVGAAEGDVEAARARLSNTLSRRVWTHPAERLSSLRERVATARRRGESAAAARVKIERRLLQARKAQLSALDPKRVLARGYVLVETSDGALVGSKEQANAHQKVQIIWHDGRAAATIEN